MVAVRMGGREEGGVKSEQGETGRQTGVEGSLVTPLREEEGVRGVLVVHNSLLWPTHPNEPER